MKTSALILAVVLSVSTNIACANELPQLSATQKYAQSDAVVIGRVAKVTRNTYDGTEYATIAVSAAIKGLVPQTIEVETVGNISEWNFNVAVNNDYVFYLQKISEGKYMSIAGRNGVLAYDPN